jgi:hypothetical protein
MRRNAGAVSLVAALVASAPAWSVSLTNRDDRDHKVTVIEGASRQDHQLAAQAVLEGVCLKGCIVRLNDSDNDEYELEGNEIVSIEDGYLYYDGPDAPTEQAPADPAKPEPKKQ